MAELADALDLGSSEETHAGSIPVSRTKLIERLIYQSFFVPKCKTLSICTLELHFGNIFIIIKP